MKKKLLIILPLVLCALSSCSSNNGFYYYQGGVDRDYQCDGNTDEYLKIEELDFVSPQDEPKSSFSLDSSGAAYSNIRRMINAGDTFNITPDQVIIEQMINYFNYDYEAPINSPVSVYSEMGVCPWNEEAYLASVAVKTKEIDYSTTSNNNYVLLIDTSGSMSSSDRLPLVKKGFKMLVDNLKDDDVVSIVTYSGNESTLLDGGTGKEKNKIKSRIDKLQAYGSTNGEGGIKQAYKLAKKHYIPNGTNQILIATDGDFNVGLSYHEDLKELVKKELESGISLSCFGFGMGNYHDTTMQTLALNGNGNVFYIDDEKEMERVFSGNISSILKVVAKDAKIQVTFDENKVSKYRLIGYENKMMSSEEFDDENKDAGEIYSNRTVVALYEVVPLTNENNELYNIELKYKDPSTNESSSISKSGPMLTNELTGNHVFASAVAEFGLLLRNSQYKKDASYDNVLSLYESKKETFDRDSMKHEFNELVTKVNDLNK